MDGLVVTNLDRVPKPRMCVSYEASLKPLPWGIRVLRPAEAPIMGISHLEYQEGTGMLLERCEPAYQEFPYHKAFLAGVQDQLGVPVVLTSHGPTHDDKTLLQETP